MWPPPRAKRRQVTQSRIRTQQIDADGLAIAIRAEWAHRGLDGDPHFAPPAHWRTLYPAEARKVPACGEVTTFPAAVDLVGALLVPALDGSVTGRQWSPGSQEWGAIG